MTENDINADSAMGNIFLGGRDDGSMKLLAEKTLSDTILPYRRTSGLLPGSTDVGDVSWIAPTAQLAVACQAFGTPPHSWQQVSQSKSPLAHKGMLTAARVMARTGAQLLRQPDIVERAKAELRDALGGTRYVCPIPEGVRPKPFKAG